MGRDETLNATPDLFGENVVLANSRARSADLRFLAELWRESRGLLVESLDELAEALDRPAEGWDEAVIDFEVDTQMPEAKVKLAEQEARRLQGELGTAADRTFAAQIRTAPEYRAFARQQDRSAA